jgi:drug/metabolite transporter (DMT)-like permease
VPQSKSRRRRYQAPPKKKPKPSPRWFGAIVLGLLFGGAAVIILNYLSLIPFTSIDPSNWLLFVGLGCIAAGFLAATQWH